MHSQLNAITCELTVHADQLRHCYTPDLVHDLRVCIRRIRGLLRQLGSQRARRYRKTWGGFAAMTGDARDWDVFLENAREVLPADTYSEFESVHRARLEGSRQAVVEMLESAGWQRHLEDWRRFLTAAVAVGRSSSEQLEALDRAMAKTRARLADALTTGADRDWHRLRIALKNGRYIAEAIGGDGRPHAGLETIATECAHLQTLLGQWHDAVIGLELLESLDDGPGHARLRAGLAERKEQLMAAVRERLSGSSLIAPGKTPAGTESMES